MVNTNKPKTFSVVFKIHSKRDTHILESDNMVDAFEESAEYFKECAALQRKLEKGKKK